MCVCVHSDLLTLMSVNGWIGGPGEGMLIVGQMIVASGKLTLGMSFSTGPCLCS